MNKLSEAGIARNTATLENVLAAGEGSKAFLKTGLDAINRLYDHVRALRFDETNWSIDLPMYPHEVRAKHEEAFGDHWQRVQGLVELRNSIKAMPILTRQPKEESLEAKIRRSVIDEIKASKERFDVAKRIVERLAEFTTDVHGREVVTGLNISVNHVYCSNQWGTAWLRIDWYMRGSRIAFNTLMAAIDEVKRERGQ